MIVHQFIAAAAAHDAVTDQALAWDEAMASWGHNTLIVAEWVDASMEGRVTPLSNLRRLPEPDVAILHYSIWSEVVAVARDASWPLGVYYHNITPGELLRRFNPAVADLCDRGRASLASLTRARVAIAPSQFNAQELAGAGFAAVEVVPLLLPALPKRVAERPDGPTSLLSIGRIAPNKRLEDCLRVFSLYQGSRDPGAQLTLVGSEEAFPAYAESLRNLVGELGVRNVRFTGRIPEQTKHELFEQAHGYLCMSVHEGFCVPLVEAMAMGVPVIARAAGAVPETLGGAGIVIDESDLALFAEAVHLVRHDEDLRRRLERGEAKQLVRFNRDRVSQQLRTALEPLLS